MRAMSESFVPVMLLATALAAAMQAGRVGAQEVAAPFPPGLASDSSQPGAGAEVRVAGETLEAAWRIALSTDRRLEASQWNASAAASSVEAARAERWPSMTLGANYIALSEEPAFKLPASPMLPSQLPFFEQDSGGAHAVVRQPLYASGRISSGIRAAEAGVAASQAEIRRTTLDVKMYVAEYYVSVLRATRLVEVAENRVASLTEHVRVVKAMLDRGLRARTDLLSAEVALANARQQLFQAQNAKDVACASYNRMLGRPLIEAVRLAELPEEKGVGDVDQLTSQALQNRPEIAQLSAQACELREQAAATQAKKGPQVAVAGGYLYQQDKYINPNGVAGVGLIAEWNVLDAGRVSNQAAASREKAEALIRLRMDTESAVALDVRQRWLDLQTVLRRIEVARQSIAQADENLRVARDRYEQQVGTNTEVLDAETLRVQAYTNFYNSSYEAALARLRLCRAAGSL